jgi:2-dehydro-3-deoxyphosphogluconate aldolase/(4S)-4-hydroxy-2-oxoglutarate aldolase
MQEIERIMRLAPVIPVLMIDDAAMARPIAEALVAGGLRAIEVTLRTPAAVAAIEEMAKVEGAIVGAGTVLNEGDLDRALEAGARFVVSPGLTDRLGAAAAGRKAAFLPGVANASDIMRGLDMGFQRFKFFPAQASGGVAALKAIAGPFAHVLFCPTGGVTPASAPDWLAMPNVLCVGGTWLSPRGAFDGAALTAAARQAAALSGAT